MWRDIPGYAGRYKANVEGQIWSEVSHRVLKGFSDSQGYLSVVLVKADKSQKTYKIHRLIMLTFVGESEELVLHGDDDVTNNVLSNLRYGTYAENKQDALTRGRVLRGVAHPNTKLSEAQRAEIAAKFSSGTPQKVLALEYGVSQTTVSRVSRRLTHDR